MNPLLTLQFSRLPRLNRANALAAAVPCKVCETPAPFFDVVDFNHRRDDHLCGLLDAGARQPLSCSNRPSHEAISA